MIEVIEGKQCEVTERKGEHSKVDLIRNGGHTCQVASQGDFNGSESQGMKEARPALLKVECREAWHGSSEQSAMIHWEHSWGLRQMGENSAV